MFLLSPIYVFNVLRPPSHWSSGWLYISPSEVLHTAAWVCLDEAGWGPRHFRGGAASCIRFDEAQAKSVSVSTRFLSITFWLFLFVVHVDGIDGLCLCAKYHQASLIDDIRPTLPL
jgi:hypothetical protein